jgi:hypothetical protein
VFQKSEILQIIKFEFELALDFCIFDNYSVDFSPLRRNCDVTINKKTFYVSFRKNEFG